MNIDSAGRRLFAQSLFGIALRIGSALAQLAVAVLLGRSIGAGELGNFFGWFSAITLMSAIARAGSGGVVLKTYIASEQNLAEVANYRSFQRCWSAAVALTALAIQVVAGVSPTSAIVVASGFVLLAELGVNSEIFRAIRRVSLSQLLFPLGPNIVFLVLLLVSPPETAGGATQRWVGAIAAVSILSAILTRKLLAADKPKFRSFPNRAVLSAKVHAYESSRIAAAELTTMSATWLPGLLLPVLATPTVAGVFGGAARVVRPLLIVQAAVNHSLGPRLLNKSGRVNVNIASAGSTLCLALVAPFVLFVLVMAEWILSIFGDSFVDGALALRLLVITYFLALAVGPVNLLLNLSGHAKQSARFALTGLAALAALLLLANSEIMAAIAVSAGVLSRSLLAARYVSRIEGRWIVPRVSSVRQLLEQRS